LTDENVAMPELGLNDAQLKELLKVVLLEMFQERRELLHDLMAEVLEDMAMVRAINVGKDSETVSRDEIVEILEASG